jgi:ribonuclease D
MTPIVDNAELQAFCERLTGAPFVAVDTEFMRETTYWPKLCLVQVASAHDAACIDPLAPGLDLQPLLTLLADERTIKVFHAARQDLEIFHNLGVRTAPVFDTQLAAMAAGYGEQIAYDALVRQMLKVEIDKSSRFTDWSRRPLSRRSWPTRWRRDAAGEGVPQADGPAEPDRAAGVGGGRDGGAVGPRAVRRGAGERLAPAQAPQVHAKYLAAFRAAAAWRERTGAGARPAAGPHPEGRRHRRTGDAAAHGRRGAEPPAQRAQGLRRQPLRGGTRSRRSARRWRTRRTTRR